MQTHKIPHRQHAILTIVIFFSEINYDVIKSYAYDWFSTRVTKENLFVGNSIFTLDNGQFYVDHWIITVH